MNEILFNLFTAVAIAAVTAVVRYLIPYIITALKESKHELAANIALTAVRAVEQMIMAPGSGERKYALAFDLIKQSGLKLTDEQIQVLIEAAVQAMNAEKGAHTQEDNNG